MQISAMSNASYSRTAQYGPLSWSPPRPPEDPGTVMSAQQQPQSTAAVPVADTAMDKPAPIPHMTASDRTAVAGATGVYVTPGGAMTPAATNVSWETISRYVKQRHRVADATAVAAAYNIPVSEGVSRIDVRA